MPMDFTFQIHLMMLLEKFLVMLYGLIDIKNDHIICIYIYINYFYSYFLNILLDQYRAHVLFWLMSRAGQWMGRRMWLTRTD